MAREIAFLDTMLFLHFPLFTDLKRWDWKKFLDADEVEPAISRVTYYEIDEHKDKNPVGAVKKRARTAAAAIARLIGGGQSADLGDGIILTLDLARPKNFVDYDLDPEVKDDELLLAAINRRSTQLHEVVVVSGDFPVYTKALQRSFAAYLPPEDLRFDDRGAQDKEIEDLRREILKMQSAKPRLAATHSGGEKMTRSLIPTLGVNLEDFLEERRGEFWREPTFFRSPSPSPSMGGAFMRNIDEDIYVSAERRASFNEALQSYRDRVSQFCKETYCWSEARHRLARCELSIGNIGGAPGTNLHITVRVDEGYSLMGTKMLPKLGKLPEAPTKPSRENMLMDSLERSVASIYRSKSPSHYPLGPVSTPDPAWERIDDRTLKIQLDRLVQHQNVVLPECYISVSEHRNQNIGVEVGMVCGEVSDPFTSRLGIEYVVLSAEEITDEWQTSALARLKKRCPTPREVREDQRTRTEESER